MPELAVSLQSLLGEGAEQLRRAGIPEPRREALRLWADISGTSLAETLAGASAVESVHAISFRDAARRRAGGEPFAYVTGWVGFRHLSLRIDQRALIPRPETEGLVELLLQRVRSGIVADIGTGSGCIALSLAQEGDFSRVLGVDSSADALALARSNSRLLASWTPVDLVRADLCAPLRLQSCHALIANPPYLTRGEYAQLDPSVRQWEPELALSSGPDGMEATARLITQGHEILVPGGWLALEVDCTRAEAGARLASERGWREVSIHRDLFGRERYLLARRSERR